MREWIQSNVLMYCANKIEALCLPKLSENSESSLPDGKEKNWRCVVLPTWARGESSKRENKKGSDIMGDAMTLVEELATETISGIASSLPSSLRASAIW